MTFCPGCGGVLGRDCFNAEECQEICRQMDMRAGEERALREREPTAEEYCAGTGHPIYGIDEHEVGHCYCGARQYPEAGLEDRLAAAALEGMGC